MKINLRKTLIISAMILSLQLFSHGAFAFGEIDKGLTCKPLYPLMKYMLDHHYREKKFTAELEERTVKQYLKTLDPSKIYLTKTDITDIKTIMKDLFKRLADEDCSGILKAEKLLEDRIEKVVENIKLLLKDPTFKIEDATTMQLDADKRENAADPEEHKKFLRNYLQFQMANLMVADLKVEEAKTKLGHRYELFVKHSKQKNEETLGNFLDAFSSSLDPHSNYFSPEGREDFKITMQLSFEGIGATLSSQDGYTVVEDLIPGGSAEKSGLLQRKDKIIAVGQGKDGKMEAVIDMPLRDVVKLIRGKKGTLVKLTLMRIGQESKPKMIEIPRDKVDLKDEEAKITYVDKKVGTKTLKLGVLKLPSFYSSTDAQSEKDRRSCSEDVRKLLVDAKAKKVDGIILDLSRNGGGVLGEAVKVAGLFINSGNIVETQDSGGRVDVLADTDNTIYYSGPLVLLTSRLSASASEIVAGALQDYKRAVIIGSDRTFGKGSVQAVIPLQPSWGAIKVTSGMFFLPSGKSTQEKGVSADVRIPSPYMSKDFTEEALDYALQFKAISPTLSAEANLEGGAPSFIETKGQVVTELKKRSQERVDKSEEFAKIKKELADIVERKGTVRLGDMTKRYKEDNKKEKEEDNKKVKDKQAEYLKQPAVQEALNILSDYVSMDPSRVTVAKEAKASIEVLTR